MNSGDSPRWAAVRIFNCRHVSQRWKTVQNKLNLTSQWTDRHADRQLLTLYRVGWSFYFWDSYRSNLKFLGLLFLDIVQRISIGTEKLNDFFNHARFLYWQISNFWQELRIDSIFALKFFLNRLIDQLVILGRISQNFTMLSPCCVIFKDIYPWVHPEDKFK